MVSVLASSAVDRRFELRLGQVKEIRIMYPSGATCLPADCCFSEVAL
jgi:hypothetical protein